MATVALACVTAYGVAATVGLAALAALGDRTVPTYAFGVLPWWSLGPAVVGLVMAAAMRSRTATVTVLVPAVVWLWTFGPMLVPARGTPPDPDLTVATFNISAEPGSDHVVAMIQRSDPDLVLVQEVLPGTRRRLETQLDALGLLPHRHFSDVSRSAPGGGGTGVLSALPITDVTAVDGLPDGARPTDVVTVDAGGVAVPVVSVHLTSPPTTQVLEGFADGSVRGLTVDRLGRRRVREALALAAALPADDTLVVGGDLNSSWLNQPIAILGDVGLHDTHRAVGSGPGFTRGGRRDVARIDFVLLADGLTPVSSVEGLAGSSDHRPVIVEVSLPASA